MASKKKNAETTAPTPKAKRPEMIDNKQPLDPVTHADLVAYGLVAPRQNEEG